MMRGEAEAAEALRALADEVMDTISRNSAGEGSRGVLWEYFVKALPDDYNLRELTQECFDALPEGEERQFLGHIALRRGAMTTRNISEVRRVVEVHDDRNRVQEYLDEGWILLLVYATSTDSDHGPTQYPVYILGWTSDEEAPSELEARMKGETMRSLVEGLRARDQESRDEQTG